MASPWMKDPPFDYNLSIQEDSRGYELMSRLQHVLGPQDNGRQETLARALFDDEVLPFLGFALAMFLFYSTVPVVLKISGSTMLNLSLLTSDMWAVLIRIFAYHQKVDWMYFIAFGAVVVGLMIYSGWAKEAENVAQVAEAKERDEESGVNNLVQGSTTTPRDPRPGDEKQQGSTTTSRNPRPGD